MCVFLWGRASVWPCSVTHPVQDVSWVLNETNRWIKQVVMLCDAFITDIFCICAFLTEACIWLHHGFIMPLFETFLIVFKVCFIIKTYIKCSNTSKIIVVLYITHYEQHGGLVVSTDSAQTGPRVFLRGVCMCLWVFSCSGTQHASSDPGLPYKRDLWSWWDLTG